MSSDRRRDANRRNALKSTGPKAEAGALVSRNNALTHGLRALQIVVPGEDPAAWDAHRDAVLADLEPRGAVEASLAEQVAAKLWRLGRVARHEADLIANAQHRDELLRAHERAHTRGNIYSDLSRADIPTRGDLERASRAVVKEGEVLAALDAVIGLLDALTGMADEDAFDDWNPLYEAIKAGLAVGERDLERIFRDREDEGPFLASHARGMLAIFGDPEEGRAFLLAKCRGERAEQAEKAAGVRARYRRVARRYEAALERRRLAASLPSGKDLDRIQRYEAHLERGLHKALDRLRDLREARGAIPPRGPAVAVAVVQAGQAIPEPQMASFGISS
jgi:hypothetical protein